jgi:PBSX family phage terminase large subunit
MDEPAKIKSISNPSTAWVEEGNQLTEEDWIYLMTTLRSNKSAVTIDFSFNPETTGDYTEHWLYSGYFSHTSDKTFEAHKTIKAGNESVEISYSATHATYRDNPYVRPERKAFLEDLQNINMYWYNVFTIGQWGNEENKSPWLYTFDESKHVSPVELFAKKSEILYLSFDFNRNPHACLVEQWYDDTIWSIEAIKIPNTGTDGICDYILKEYIRVKLH